MTAGRRFIALAVAVVAQNKPLRTRRALLSEASEKPA